MAASPDGSAVLCVVREPLLTEKRSEYISHLYCAGADGADEMRQLTFGEHRNTNPQWSPDGAFIAFVSTRSESVRYARDRRRSLGAHRGDKTGVSMPKWAPDGMQIAFLRQEPPSEAREKSRKARNDAVHVGVDLDFTHLFAVPFAVGPRALPDPRQITRGRYQVTAFNWLPDGRSLAIVYQPSPDEDAWTQTRLGLAPADGSGGEPAEIALVAAEDGTPCPSPDGAWIACATADQPVTWAYSARAVLYPVAGASRACSRPPPTPNPCSTAGRPPGTRSMCGRSGASRWRCWPCPSMGGSRARSSRRRCPRSAPTRRAASPSSPTTSTGRTPCICSTTRQADWPEAPSGEVIRWDAADGTPIEGILVYSRQYRPGRRFPLIVHVHGGPAGVFQRAYATERIATAALADRGYLVLQPNPRGSTGYGAAFRAANRGDWGGGDYRDIMEGVDHLIAQGLADPDRLGIMGFSYGGFMTSWTITQTDRFVAEPARRTTSTCAR